MLDRIDCEYVRGALADLAEENLPRSAERRVRDHLAACEGCQRELQALDAAASLVQEHGLLEPPPGLWNAVYNTITAPDRAPSVSRRQGWFGLRLRLGAAALAVVGVSAWFGLGLLRQPPQTASVANAVAAEYLEGHAMGSREALFADRFNLASVAALAEAEQQKDRRL